MDTFLNVNEVSLWLLSESIFLSRQVRIPTKGSWFCSIGLRHALIHTQLLMRVQQGVDFVLPRGVENYRILYVCYEVNLR